MQSDRDALLAGILADPDADLPRLVFADWLEETGHPANCARAEYIRLAIELCGPNYPPGARLTDERLNQLEQAFEDEWDVFARRGIRTAKGDVRRLRGFVENVFLGSHYAPSVYKELAQHHPVRFLSINMGRPWGRSVSIRLPSLIWLKTFTQSGVCVVNELLGSACLPQLQWLGVSDSALDDASAVRFTHTLRANTSLQTVRAIDLSDNPLTDFAAHALAAADLPPNLCELHIDRTRITNAGREVLYRRFGFEELRPRLALS